MSENSNNATIEAVDETMSDPLEFWAEKQKELVTSVVDYNLSTLTDLIVDKNINLSPIYQRRDRWDDERKSALIESFLINVPIPPIFLNEDSYGEYSIIDGKQRLTSIRDFLTGNLRLKRLEVFREFEGKNIFELPSRLQSVIKTRPTLRAVIVLRQSDEDVKFEVFRRLNIGGVSLNAQEIRNSVFSGTLNDKLLQLSAHDDFRRLLGIKNNKSRIYQEMYDVELLLRYFTFRDSWKKFDGGIKLNLDHFMDHNRYLDKKSLDEITSEFFETLAVVNAIWGENAFRRWNPETGKWRNQILSSMFEAQMMACIGFNPNRAKAKRDEILERFKHLFFDDDFQKSLKSSIPVYFTLRIEMIIDILESTIG